MSRELSALVQNQLSSGTVKTKHVLIIDNNDISNYLLNYSLDSNREFGSNSARFTLNNNTGIFHDTGSLAIKVGDIVKFSQWYLGDDTEWKKFYGQVNQRSKIENSMDRTIELVCLDYIASLQFIDIDLEVEGEKIKIEDEILTPNYLPAPNNTLAQVFNFANDAIADNPLPLIVIRNKDTNVEDPAFDGFEVLYPTGQLKMGFPLNTKDNYDIVSTYHYYVAGIYAEDILELILCEPDGYGNYLFGETSAANVVANHLTDTFLNVEDTSTDYLTPNYTSTSIIIFHRITQAITAGATVIYLDSVEGLPYSGQASINGDIFTWTSIVNGYELHGIPTSGSLSLSNHTVDSYFKYESTYGFGRVWYLKFSNIVSVLNYSNFTIPGASLSYFDAREGRIILDKSISLNATVTCNVSYTFKTLGTTGIQLNAISFRSREVENRYEAINKVKEFLAPNYHIYTRGDNKIWGQYIYQKVNADYTLQLATNLSYMEDEDIYTRVIVYGKNKNPTNIMFGEGVSFVGTGATYKATASNIDLTYLSTEDNYFIYGTAISEIGRITANLIKPQVYVNSVAIDNKAHIIVGQKVVIETTQTTETTMTSSK